MKVFVVAAALALVGAFAASMILNDRIQEPAWKAFATDGARVGDPGDNLVGKDWAVERKS